jgi:diguanylate cyclase (GGDEF)-like protein/PAS domain S-box-containing protein
MHIQAEANLSALIESTDDLIWAVDLDYCLIAFNHALQRDFETTFGVRLAMGMRLHDHLPPEKGVLWPPFFERALRTGPFHTEYPMLDGRTLEMYFNPILVDGEASGISVFGKDITERKRAEKQLRDSEERYRATFDQAAIGIVHTSFEGPILRCNARFAEILGYTPDEIRGMTFQQITLPEDLPESLAILKRLSTGEIGSASWEKRYLRKDGSVTWAKLAVSIQRDGEGRPLHYLGMVEDINALKAAEARLAASTEALQVSESRYSTVFETSSDAVVISRMSDGVILEANQAFLDSAGYERNEVIGHTIAELGVWVHESDKQRFADALRENGKCRDFEVLSRRKNGEIFWMRLSASLIEIDGIPCRVAFARDISEIKAAEEATAAAREVQRFSEELHKTVFQTCPSAILIGRVSDGTILDANKTFLDWTRYERNEVVGHTTLELGLWANVADRQRLIDELLRNQGCRDMEFQFRRRDGEIFWLRLSATLIEVGGTQCMLAFAQDVSAAKAAAEALRLSEEHYRAVFQTSVDGIAISQLSDGKYIDVNRAFLDMMGFDREEIVGRTSQELNYWADPGARLEMVKAVRERSGFRDLQTRFVKRGGAVIWVQISASAIEVEGVACVLSVMQDITAAKDAEALLTAATEALRLSEERYRTAFQTSLDAININRLSSGKFIDVNQAFLDILGYEREEVIGRTSLELGVWANPRDRQQLVDMLTETSSCRGLEAQFRKKNGEVFWGELSASSMEIDGVACLLSITRDISEAKAAESTIRNLAFYDPLTGLPNRRLLLERLRPAVAVGARNDRLHALLLVDLDNFKTLNDTLGHHAGDILLKQVAQRLVVCCGEADNVYRLGGDEFVVMLDELSEDSEDAAAQAKAAGEIILASIGQSYLLDDRECLLAASIGVTVFGDRQSETDDIMQQMDIAQHQAKSAGRNSIRFFSPALQAAVNARAALEEDLRHAIKANQFQLYYQPQVERGRLTGAEALIRWKHPMRGIVPPDEFIPVSEESRLILPMGVWVLEAACRQIALWAGKHETAHLAISVNISALQFRQPEFIEQVLAALDRTGANPRFLKLELTESLLVESFEDVIDKMTELKSHGLSFSLDDFGTGYSSLAYLKRLPLDELKIDRTFVRDMMVDVTSGAIAQTIISLGRAMDLSVMAEGVETEEQRGFLAGLGCHSFQGYLFSRPLPLMDFERFLEQFS